MVSNADYIREASYLALAVLLKPKNGEVHPQALPLFSIPDDEMVQFEKDFKNTNKYDFLFQ